MSTLQLSASLKHSHGFLQRGRTFAALSSGLLAAVALSATPGCSSTSSTPDADAGDAAADSPSSDAPPQDAPPVMCASPGGPTPGVPDTHCALPDGGMTVQPTSMASCNTPDAAAGDGGAGACGYGDTMYGQESDDDDCKYHVKWTTTPICEGSPGVRFTVTATHKTDGSPLTGLPLGVSAETFIPTTLDAACDTISTHAGPNTGVYLVETTAGSGVYAGDVAFDAPGIWTVRFHFHLECDDVFPDSPHGHAAYRVTVP